MHAKEHLSWKLSFSFFLREKEKTYQTYTLQNKHMS